MAPEWWLIPKRNGGSSQNGTVAHFCRTGGSISPRLFSTAIIPARPLRPKDKPTGSPHCSNGADKFMEPLFQE